MRLLEKEILHDFKAKQTDARSQVEAWEAEVEEAQWKNPHDMKQAYPKASILGNQYVVFDILGNRFRLLAKVYYQYGTVLVKKIGTHKEYDKWQIN